MEEKNKNLTDEQLSQQLRKQMYDYAKLYEFEKAAVVRDQIALLEKYMLNL